MKKFTKVCLIIAAIGGGLGVICIIAALACGLTWGRFQAMVYDGEFTWGPRLGWIQDVEERITGDYHSESSADDYDTENSNVFKDCRNLDVEIGAGQLVIERDDVEDVVVKESGGLGTEVKKDGRTLKIESAVSFGGEDGTITILLPEDQEFHEVDLEVGAGQIDASGLAAKDYNISVGTGEVLMSLPETETDYSYNIECGMGTVTLGENSYSGLGTERKIHNDGAGGEMDIECGAGNVEISFEEE